MDSPALGKAELVVGGCASWTFSKGGRRKLLRSKAKKTAQRTARAPCAASLAASHVHSSRAAPAAGTPLAHTRLQGMLTGAPVLCIWGVTLDLVHLAPISDACVGPENLQLQKVLRGDAASLIRSRGDPVRLRDESNTARGYRGLRDTRARCLVLAPVPCAL